MKRNLLLIDPQNDFCETNGSLFVKGADRDMKNLTAFVRKNADKFENIFVTMDLHHPFSIFFPSFWIDAEGNHPKPGTIIKHADVLAKKWMVADKYKEKDAITYLVRLEENKKHELCIWPLHCLIGDPGSNIQFDLLPALYSWEIKNQRKIDFVRKGTSQLTEHYSAVGAEVPLTWDSSTEKNMHLIYSIDATDEIVVAGEALSHCVAETLRHIFESIFFRNIQKYVLLADCTSSVPGFERYGKEFIDESVQRGMRLSTSEEYKF